MCLLITKLSPWGWKWNFSDLREKDMVGISHICRVGSSSAIPHKQDKDLKISRQQERQ